MSFASPKTELPGSMSDNTPGRANTYRQSEVVPLVFGRARVGAKWITPVLNWRFNTTKTSQYAFFSCVGVLCQGPIDRVFGLHVNGKPYHGIDIFRSDSVLDYAELVLPLNTTERYRIWWGTETQGSSSWLQSLVTNPGHAMYGKVHPGYRGICYIGIQDMLAGPSTGGATPALANVEVELHRISPTAYSFGYQDHGTHPVGVIRDIYQDKRGGLGLPNSFFDSTDWTAKMSRMMTQGIAGRVGTDLWISPLLTEPKQAYEVMGDLLSYIDGWVRWKNGKVEIDWYPNDGSDPGSIRELSWHDFVQEPEIEAEGLEDIVSTVAVTALDQAATDVSLPEIVEVAQVPYALQLKGEPHVEQINRPFYVTRNQAKAYAAMIAAIKALPDLKGTIVVRRESATQPDGITPLLPGDRFNLDYAPFALDLLCRVIERNDSEDKTDVTIRFAKERGASPTPYVPALDPRTPITQPVAGPITDYLAIEIPYETSPREVAILAVRPVNTLSGFRIHYSPTNTWPGTVLASYPFWAIKGLLKTSLTAVFTTATISIDASGIDFPDLMVSQTGSEQADDQLLMIANGEWFAVGAITPTGGTVYSINVLRGRQKTTPVVHHINDVIWFVRRAELCVVAHPDFGDAGLTRWFKIQGYNNVGDSASISAAFSLALTNHVPGVPQNLRITVGTGKMIKIEWDTAPNADEYTVYRATGPGYSDEVEVANVTEPRFYDVDVVGGTAYRYRIVTQSPDEDVSGFSAPVSGTAGTFVSGSDGIVGFLTNEAQALAADSSGAVLSFAAAVTEMFIFEGTTDASATWAVSKVDTNCTSTLVGRVATVTALSANVGYIDFTATKTGRPSIIKRFTVSKVVWGVNGVSGTAFWLGTLGVLKKDAIGIYSPSVLSLSAFSSAGASAPAPYACRFIIADSPDGSTFTNRYTSSSDESTKSYTPNSGITMIRVRMYLAGGTTTLVDEQFVPIVIDGTTGTPASGVLLQYSIDGSTSWHSTLASSDMYVRFSVDGGSSWSIAQKFKAVDGATPYLHVKYSNDNGATFTSSSGEDVGAYVGTCVDFNLADPTTVGAYTWGRVTGYREPNAPSNPSPASVVSSGLYETHDGIIKAYFIISVPPLPANSTVQNVIVSTDYTDLAKGNIATQLYDTSTRTVRIDDLSPGVTYAIGTQAWNDNPSGIVSATGSPLTSPTKTSGPTAPPNAGIRGPSSSGTTIPPVRWGTVLLLAAQLYWDAPPEKDLDYYEYVVRFVNDPDSPISSWVNGISITKERVANVYNPVPSPGYAFVRAKNRSGSPSAWVYLGNVNSVCALPLGSVSVQDADGIETTGVKVGGASSVKQNGQVPVYVSIHLDGGGVSEELMVTISDGLPYKPDWMTVSINGWPTMMANYHKSNASNTATSVGIIFQMGNNSLLPGGYFQLQGLAGTYV